MRNEDIPAFLSLLWSLLFLNYFFPYEHHTFLLCDFFWGDISTLGKFYDLFLQSIKY